MAERPTSKVEKVKTLRDSDWEDVSPDEWEDVSAAPVEDPAAIRAAQAANPKYQTAAEKGGKPGTAVTAHAPWLPDVLAPAQKAVNTLVHTAPEKGPYGGPIVSNEPPLAAGLFAGGASQSPQNWTGLANAVKTSPGAQLAQRVLGRLPNVPVAPETTAAMSNVEKLGASSKEAQATAGRIADEAMQRGSIPNHRNPNVRDHYVFRNMANAEAELRAAKESLPAGQRLVGQPLLERFDTAVAKYQTETPPHLRFGPTTTSVQGGEYDPLLSVTQENLPTARSNNLGAVRNRVAKLVDDSGHIDAKKLQGLKEQIDREIYEHAGWRDTGTAAEKSNLEALREANGYIRNTLEELGNTQLNEANAAYSHYADIAKIVESRRPDLEGLANSEAKAARALRPLQKPQPSVTRRMLRNPYVRGAISGAAGTGILGGALYELRQP